MNSEHTRRTRGKNAYRGGQLAEAIAVFFLRLKGYRILDRRLRTPAGEIDILAEKGEALVIIEVKKRSDEEQAGAALAPRQQQRLHAAAAHILARYGAGKTVRFDVMLFAGGFWPRHIPNAF